jgi:spore maturation protein CgeB
MRILFVWPVATFSVWDVARGYRSAFAKIVGEENIRDYNLNTRSDHHRRALPAPQNIDPVTVSRLASETVVCEAIYFDADVVFIVSGLNFHPVALNALRKIGIHVATILTESPYDDDPQLEWTSVYPEMSIFTNELISAKRYGWEYVPHSYDPEIHKPVPPSKSCDVLMCGTGWVERQKVLEAVDWEGIDLRLMGLWPSIEPHMKLAPYVHQGCIDNLQMPAIYAGAKICLNIHREFQGAMSLNPRAYEVAACGAFQISDYRKEIDFVFGDSVPVFYNPDDLGRLIRHYLANDGDRVTCAITAKINVNNCTFDHRAEQVIDKIRRDLKAHQSRKAHRSEVTT